MMNAVNIFETNKYDNVFRSAAAYIVRNRNRWDFTTEKAFRISHAKWVDNTLIMPDLVEADLPNMAWEILYDKKWRPLGVRFYLEVWDVDTEDYSDSEEVKTIIF